MKPTWDLCEATTLVRQLVGPLALVGYCPALTGGVLFNGCSDKDIDLVLFELGTLENPCYESALEVLSRELSAFSIVTVNHKNQQDKLVFTLTMQDKRRIDIFVPGYRWAERTDKLATAGEIEGSGAGEEASQ